MQKDILSNVEKMNKATLDSAKRLGEINLKVFEKLTERQLEFASDYFETGLAQMKLIGESKDIQAVVQGQSKFVSELNQKTAEHAKKTAEVLADARGDYAEWVEQGLQAADFAPIAKAATSSGGGSKKAA